MFRIAGQDRFTIGLTAVDDDLLGSAMALEGLAQKPFGRGDVAPLAEPELDRVAMAIDGTVQVRPAPADFDVGFVNVPFPLTGRLCRLNRCSSSGE